MWFCASRMSGATSSLDKSHSLDDPKHCSVNQAFAKVKE
jgi:hypothetical protein